MISVDPKYQRQGAGAMLMQWGCDDVDANGQDAFVMASPAGIRLYEKYGFTKVGEVVTTKGTFTSMLRESRSRRKAM
jgi:ribosomal protein S18 acetylase RimI-like enzyme